MSSWLYFVFWILVIGGFIGFRIMKKSNNRKAAESGEDKELVRKAAVPLLATGAKHLYAHWEEREHYGRTVKTTYHRYVVTYQSQTLCVAPLYIDKKTRQMQVGRPSVFTPENLGRVTVNTKRKNDMADHMEIYLLNKQGETVFQFHVDAENLRKSKWFPVNIAQQEECTAFEGFIDSLAQRVAAENPNVDALIKANDNRGLGYFGAILSVIGAVISFFFPPAGIFLTLIGLCLSVVSKAKGAPGKKALIISIICFIWSAFFVWLYLTIM